VYQFVAVTVLTPLGMFRSQALAQIIVLQAVGYVVVIVWGGTGLWRLSGMGNLVRWRGLIASPSPPSAEPAE